MTTILILGAVIAAGCWYLLYRSQQRLTQQLNSLDAQLAKPRYRCVVIEAGAEACAQIRSHPAQPMLLDQAPILPLAGCNMAKCGCHFLRLDDRRSGADRRALSGLDKKTNLTANKRFVKERRISALHAPLVPKRKQLTRNISH